MNCENLSLSHNTDICLENKEVFWRMFSWQTELWLTKDYYLIISRSIYFSVALIKKYNQVNNRKNSLSCLKILEGLVIYDDDEFLQEKPGAGRSYLLLQIKAEKANPKCQEALLSQSSCPVVNFLLILSHNFSKELHQLRPCVKCLSLWSAFSFKAPH